MELLEEILMKEVISANTPEELLRTFEGCVQNGFTLDTIDPFFGIGAWQITVKKRYVKRTLRNANAKVTLPTNDAIYTQEELDHGTWESLVALAKHRGVKIRAKAQIIKDILAKQRRDYEKS